MGGWDLYGEDWRHYYECMLAPVARQVSVTLDKLDLVPVAGGLKAMSATGGLSG